MDVKLLAAVAVNISFNCFASHVYPNKESCSLRGLMRAIRIPDISADVRRRVQFQKARPNSMDARQASID